MGMEKLRTAPPNSGRRSQSPRGINRVQIVWRKAIHILGVERKYLETQDRTEGLRTSIAEAPPQKLE